MDATDSVEEPFEPSTGVERVADWVATLVSAAPTLGGPIAAVIGGWSNQRRFDRVARAIKSIATDVARLDPPTVEQYIKSDEFLELLENGLSFIARTRSERKRDAFAAVLSGAVRDTSRGYDENERMLRVIDAIMDPHISLLAALTVAPSGPVGLLFGSPIRTLQRRLAPHTNNEIVEWYGELVRAGLVQQRDLHLHTTPDGSERLGSLLTPLGERVVAYLRQGNS